MVNFGCIWLYSWETVNSWVYCKICQLWNTKNGYPVMSEKKAVEWLTRCDGWAWAGFPFGRVNYLTTANRWAAIRNSFPLLVIIGQSLTEVIRINLIIHGQTKVKFLSKSLRISKNSNKNFLEGGKSRKLESFDRYGNINGLSNSFVPRDIWQKHCKLPDYMMEVTRCRYPPIRSRFECQPIRKKLKLHF